MKNKLINANDIAKWYSETHTDSYSDVSNWLVIKEIVEHMPSADAEFVIHAHWEYKRRHYGGFECRKYVCEDGQTHTVKIDNRWEENTPYCSNCGKFSYEVNKPNYCSFCGAKMDEEEGK